MQPEFAVCYCAACAVTAAADHAAGSIVLSPNDAILTMPGTLHCEVACGESRRMLAALAVVLAPDLQQLVERLQIALHPL